MTARKPPRQPEERLSRWLRSMTPGTVDGRVASASPTAASIAARVRARPGAPGVAGVSWQQDDFTSLVTGSPPPTAYTLTYQPVSFSERVYINGLRQRPGTDYTISGRTLTMSAGLLTAGDTFGADYEYLASVPTAPSQPVTGPTIWLKLDESAGSTAADSSGNAYDFNYTAGCTLGQPSLLHSGTGSSVSLNGSNGYLYPLSALAISDGPTVTAAVRVKTTATAIMSLWDRDVYGGAAAARQWQFRLNAGKVEVILFDGTGSVLVDLTGTTSVNDGTAHHVAFTVDGTTLRIYVDGTLDASTAGTLHGTGAQLILGASHSGSGGLPVAWFSGLLDEAKYWDGHALTASEIATESGL